MLCGIYNAVFAPRSIGMIEKERGNIRLVKRLLLWHTKAFICRHITGVAHAALGSLPIFKATLAKTRLFVKHKTFHKRIKPHAARCAPRYEYKVVNNIRKLHINSPQFIKSRCFRQVNLSLVWLFFTMVCTTSARPTKITMVFARVTAV